jgi:hypothetical protein
MTQNCHGNTFVFGMPPPTIAIYWWWQRINTSIISFTMCLFVAISSLCWDNNIEVDSIKKMSDYRLTSYMSGCLSTSYISRCLSNSYTSRCLSTSYTSRCLSTSYISRCLSTSYMSRCLSTNYTSRCLSTSYTSRCLSTSYISRCLSTSYMRTQYLYTNVVMNVWLVVYGDIYNSFVSTSLTVKYNTRRAINSILWKWTPKSRRLFKPQAFVSGKTNIPRYYIFFTRNKCPCFKPLNRTFPLNCTDSTFD